MGLDNGIEVKSRKRELTRAMLPSGIVYPYDFGEKDTEILYWRKNWGLRNRVVNMFPLEPGSDWRYVIDTPNDVFELISLIVEFMDKKTWEEEGDSIWDYDEELPILRRNVINLAIIAAFMENNPDVYLEFYDSY